MLIVCSYKEENSKCLFCKEKECDKFVTVESTNVVVLTRLKLCREHTEQLTKTLFDFLIGGFD